AGANTAFAAPMRVRRGFRVQPLLCKTAEGHLSMPLAEILLLADPETVDELAVPGRVLGFEVVEKPPALADELEQAAAGVMVLLVRLEMLGEVMDALGEQCDLDLRRAGISFVRAELLHHRRLAGLVVQRA